MGRKRAKERLPWKECKKVRLSTNLSEDAYERIRFACYLTKKIAGEIISDLANEQLEDVPEEFLKRIRENRAKK